MLVTKWTHTFKYIKPKLCVTAHNKRHKIVHNTQTRVVEYNDEMKSISVNPCSEDDRQLQNIQVHWINTRKTEVDHPLEKIFD